MTVDALVGATETAIIVPVPAAEPVVGRHRQVWDHSAAWGVPAHVTVLYPFVEPHRLADDTVAGVRAALAGVPAFECMFSQVRWFGDDVAWLAPEPDEPFRVVTAAVLRRFPAYSPYQGAHPDPVPHLTVGSRRTGDVAQLRRAAAEVQVELPISAHVDVLYLIAGTDAPGSWRTVAEFALPPAP